MDNQEASTIATKLLLGCASEAEREALAAYTRTEALKVARWCARNNRLRPADCDDVAQDAAIRAIGHVWSWRLNPRDFGTSWGTYVNAITRRVVADYGRKYASEQRKLEALKELEDDNQ